MLVDFNKEDILDTYEKLGVNTEWRSKLIFLSLFLYTNKLQTSCDKLDENITIKQWLVIMMTMQFKDAPTLSQLGEVLGCSRQNVKKISVSLEKRGYINLVRGDKDGRALTVKLTDKCLKHFDEKYKSQIEILHIIFGRLNDAEIESLFKLLCKLFGGIEDLEKGIR